MEHGLKYIAFYVQSHITLCTVAITSLLVRDKPIGAPASVKRVYQTSWNYRKSVGISWTTSCHNCCWYSNLPGSHPSPWKCVFGKLTNINYCVFSTKHTHHEIVKCKFITLTLPCTTSKGASRRRATPKWDISLSGHWMGHLLSYSLSGGHDGVTLPINLRGLNGSLELCLELWFNDFQNSTSPLVILKIIPGGDHAWPAWMSPTGHSSQQSMETGWASPADSWSQGVCWALPCWELGASNWHV